MSSPVSGATIEGRAAAGKGGIAATPVAGDLPRISELHGDNVGRDATMAISDRGEGGVERRDRRRIG